MNLGEITQRKSDKRHLNGRRFHELLCKCREAKENPNASKMFTQWTKMSFQGARTRRKFLKSFEDQALNQLGKE
ncbi:unnamed protein product [Allacma fusca]|uniref:Uncharacterized protein n=1 Tax=Allacma fusca TaxID=39272 RepID=A0A8J2K2F1_9HEXA|nr:unnamed protein product [Allacma fusca]